MSSQKGKSDPHGHSLHHQGEGSSPGSMEPNLLSHHLCWMVYPKGDFLTAKFAGQIDDPWIVLIYQNGPILPHPSEELSLFFPDPLQASHALEMNLFNVGDQSHRSEEHTSELQS